MDFIMRKDRKISLEFRDGLLGLQVINKIRLIKIAYNLTLFNNSKQRQWLLLQQTVHSDKRSLMALMT